MKSKELSENSDNCGQAGSHGIIVVSQNSELGCAWLWWWLEHKGRKWILPLCREMT